MTIRRPNATFRAEESCRTTGESRLLHAGESPRRSTSTPMPVIRCNTAPLNKLLAGDPGSSAAVHLCAALTLPG
jgi:hypothetical protein